jgi:hypothetical protein
VTHEPPHVGGRVIRQRGPADALPRRCGVQIADGLAFERSPSVGISLARSTVDALSAQIIARAATEFLARVTEKRRRADLDSEA